MTQHVLLCVLLMHLHDVISECPLQSKFHAAVAGAAQLHDTTSWSFLQQLAALTRLRHSNTATVGLHVVRHSLDCAWTTS